jgi:hypothetical protein
MSRPLRSGGRLGEQSEQLRLPGRHSPGRTAGLLVIIGAAALAVASIAAPEEAHAICSVLSHFPCTPYVGSVFRRHPFTPYSCGVFGGPCSPQIVLPFRQVPVIKIDGHDGPPEPVDRDHPLDRLDEIARLLSKCLELPPDGQSQAGMELALKLAFKRDGELLADPRFTYTHDASQKVKEAYHAAALDMLKRCTPLPITDKFGGAIAGRPFVVAIRDTRDLTPGGRPAVPAAPPPVGNGTPGDSKP